MALCRRFILLCKHVRDQKDAKIIGVQAHSTIKQLSQLEHQVQCLESSEQILLAVPTYKYSVKSSFHQLQARRHLLADQANAQDQQMYEAKQAQLDQDIDAANAELDRSKVKLQAARQDKKRKLQYEVRLAALLSHSSIHKLASWLITVCCHRRSGRNVCSILSDPRQKQRLQQCTKKLKHCRLRLSRQYMNMRCVKFGTERSLFAGCQMFRGILLMSVVAFCILGTSIPC